MSNVSRLLTSTWSTNLLLTSEGVQSQPSNSPRLLMPHGCVLSTLVLTTLPHRRCAATGVPCSCAGWEAAHQQRHHDIPSGKVAAAQALGPTRRHADVENHRTLCDCKNSAHGHSVKLHVPVSDGNVPSRAVLAYMQLLDAVGSICCMRVHLVMYVACRTFSTCCPT